MIMHCAMLNEIIWNLEFFYSKFLWVLQTLKHRMIPCISWGMIIDAQCKSFDLIHLNHHASRNGHATGSFKTWHFWLKFQWALQSVKCRMIHRIGWGITIGVYCAQLIYLFHVILMCLDQETWHTFWGLVAIIYLILWEFFLG